MREVEMKAMIKKPIEEFIADDPLLEFEGETCDRRTVSKIDVPEGVTEIEQETFHCCINLSSIKLPSTLTSIARTAFYSNL